MNILNRLKRLEANSPNRTVCFCNKTLINLWYGDTDADALTYCPNCKTQFDVWANMTAEAMRSENLTDAG